MAHSNIYTKFLIEYDKANITSSYPSLTDYEIATILDKAYLAIISLKLTGYNVRKAGFEEDIKAIEDIRPLIKTKLLTDAIPSDVVSNEYTYTIPQTDYMYYVSGLVNVRRRPTSIDRRSHTVQPVVLVSHEEATKFMSTSSNLPWLKQPVVYIDGNKLHVLIDAYEQATNPGDLSFSLTYVKKFNKFAIGDGISDNRCDFGQSAFELSDSVAEEMISLAVAMAAETVESPRLTTKTNTIPFEP